MCLAWIRIQEYTLPKIIFKIKSSKGIHILVSRPYMFNGNHNFMLNKITLRMRFFKKILQSKNITLNNKHEGSISHLVVSTIDPHTFAQKSLITKPKEKGTNSTNVINHRLI